MKKFVFIFFLIVSMQVFAQRTTINFNKDWKFFLGNDSTAIQPTFNDSKWRTLNLPHDWSIELPFDEKAPATNQGGALPGGIGWYRKTFTLPSSAKNKKTSIEFDGIYRNSEVWINGHYIGKRPNGYISFQYDLTPYLLFNQQNVLVVKADNSQQPNSRWYSGSGIYRNVRLVIKNTTSIDYLSTSIITSAISKASANVHVQFVVNMPADKKSKLYASTIIYAANGSVVANKKYALPTMQDTPVVATQQMLIHSPILWSVNNPYLYKAVTTIYENDIAIDKYATTFGVRYFNFDVTKGFSLNGKSMKILGVCMHHDLGALGAAVNIAAIERQLRILKEMGCNAIRTAHNPPAPEFLDACDRMGFLVMDEAFDMWKKKKNKYDYYADFAQWHQQDVAEQIKRDRNHPSVFMWSIGNEIREQFDSSGIALTKELVAIVKRFDTTRPVTSAITETDTTKNFIYQSNALDVLGFNYHHELYKDFLKNFPNKKFVAAETMSALASRGHYDMPSDSMRYWPQKSTIKFVEDGNADYTVSAYDNVAAYWGTNHETTWKIIKKYDFLSGLFVWSGFDFLGEPVPYAWPARSSYYGIIDLAGFPKDVYYMYQSEWTNKPVLHIFPHWNWDAAQMVDVWSYYNNADEVELFLNGKSLGVRRKQGDDLHVMWKVKFEPGTLKAISRKNGKTVLEKIISTAGKPAKIELTADRRIIHPNGNDLSFITVKIVDEKGNFVPNANNEINFSIEGNATIEGVDNGYPANLQPFKTNHCKAYNGLCLVIIKSKEKTGTIKLTATSAGLASQIISINVQ